MMMIMSLKLLPGGEERKLSPHSYYRNCYEFLTLMTS